MLTKGKLDPVVAFRDGLCDLKGADKLGGIQMDGVLALELLKIPLVFGNFPSTSRAEKSKVPLQNTRLFPVTPIS
ncbi:MAG: hypothetical protein ACLSB9_27390 [Hydrogeniiclostridium mannosilyticum]